MEFLPHFHTFPSANISSLSISSVTCSHCRFPGQASNKPGH